MIAPPLTTKLLLLGFLAAGAVAGADQPVVLPPVEVTSPQHQEMLNSIDRKVYNVAQDAQGVTGSAADVLANLPSVEVDVDGNVSLRGDSNVQILIDGRSSSLTGANQADFLSQYPADTIERIEVITNPSARYKPDGTAGIINIVLKKQHAPGYAGSVHLLVGNRWRGSVTATGNYNPGRYNLFGSFTLKQDDRIRYATDRRTEVDPATGLATTTATVTTEHARLISQVGRAGFDWAAGPGDRLGETVDYSYRTMKRSAQEESVSDGTAYDRLRYDPEGERDVVSRTTYEHRFGRDDDTLSLEARWEHHDEIDNNGYTDVYQVPVAPTSFDRTRDFTNEPSTEFLAEYSNQLRADARLEAGYDRSEDRSSQDQEVADLDPATQQWVTDPTVTNLFKLDQTVDALYGTYRQRWGEFGAMLGLRAEAADVRTDQVTAAIAGDQRYLRLYPTLHTTDDLTPAWQLQLNYSHRVHRPESDDLNPYPQYQDPYNLRAGNPQLRPEEIHSLEAGVQYRQDDTTYVATLFYRYSYNGFTTISEFVSPTTLLTTEENLATTQSGGLELAATVSPWKALSLNASGDLYSSQISAANLGYAGDRSAFAWTGKGSVEYSSSKATLWQLNANYSARRLTPQGYRLPTFVANFGVKHDFKGRRWSAVFTISDLFDSLKDETRLDTPTLHDDALRRRSSRNFSAGLIWNFGSPKKGKVDAFQFDNQI